MAMMFMSYVSICVASIPGAGVCGSANERLPILHTLNPVLPIVELFFSCFGKPLPAPSLSFDLFDAFLPTLTASPIFRISSTDLSSKKQGFDADHFGERGGLGRAGSRGHGCRIGDVGELSPENPVQPQLVR